MRLVPLPQTVDGEADRERTGNARVLEAVDQLIAEYRRVYTTAGRERLQHLLDLRKRLALQGARREAA